EKSSAKLHKILSLMSFENFEKDLPIFEAIANAMKMAGRLKPVLEDTARKPVKFMGVFLKSFVLGRLLNKALPDDKYVGLMIPTSNACALSFFGLHAFGKVPAMINFTSGPKQVISTCQTVGLKHIVTAKKVVLMAKLEGLISKIEEAGIKVVYLEDLKETLTFKDKMFGVFGALFPHKAYKKSVPAPVKSTDPAVILFTSGSEGMPKAVFLSHTNMIANGYQVLASFDIYPTDVFLNCLPLFHSFGLGAGTILPLIAGVKTVLYPTPLHYRIIPEICASTKATVFFGTDTFLAGYAKCANPYDFNSLRIVAAGAEKVKDETRKIWAEKFGVRILEGYGATECSPFISVNTFLHQKKDSVGLLLPGIEYKLKPVEGIKEGQELWVKGPNIMLGYMRHTAPLTMEPPESGWYDTGDIVSVDEHGFVSIKGRCKRFAKIGGEMVSLLSVEMVIEKQWPGFISGAVNIPDPKKGEKIVLITTCKSITKEGLIEAFKAAGVTELGLPSQIITTDQPPLLGTGKFDYVKAKEMALENGK
ncbi:MAG: AMP-binding protein, partial [Alphaproteobacteria bacterium]|nr:AMP-binding protein [Alphaproteobacteria bacterium]